MAGRYKSSVLRTHADEDGCAVCEFLSGSRDVEHMLEVIRILDKKLAEHEYYSGKTLQAALRLLR